MDRTHCNFPGSGVTCPAASAGGHHDSRHDHVDLYRGSRCDQLVGNLLGIGVLFGLLGAKRLDAWTAIFLAATVLTSVTGFGFPFDHLLPSHQVGILSLAVLAVAILARYVFHLTGAWRWIYVVGAVIALYLNVFVLVFQLFEEVPALKALAPTQSEPPFLVAQIRRHGTLRPVGHPFCQTVPLSSCRVLETAASQPGGEIAMRRGC